MTSLADRAHFDFAPAAAPVPALRKTDRHASRSGVTFGVDVLLSAATGLGAVVAVSPHGPAELAFLAALPVLWVAALGFARGYRSGDELWSGSSLRPVWRAFAWTAAFAILPALFFRDAVQQTTAAELVVLGMSTVGTRAIPRLRGTNRVGPRLLLVGSATAVQRVREKLEAAAPQGRRVEILQSAVAPAAGRVPAQRGPDAATQPRSAEAHPLETLLQEVDRTGAQAVMLASASALSDTEARRLAWELAERGVELLLSTEAFGAHSSRTVPVSVCGTHAVRIAPPQLDGPAKFVKAAFERTAAFVGLVVLLPLLAVIAVLIRLTSRGPALFRQERTGRDGQVFVVYKFRTMRLGAADQFLALAAEAGESSLFFKLERDPRITRLGAFLRKTSLDELPQLLNVVLGNMALVGPRPLPVEVDQSDDVVQRRLRALPGITGQWQVSGRSSLKGDQAVEHDVDYVDNWRLGLDADILRRTVSAVLRSDGAY